MDFSDIPRIPDPEYRLIAVKARAREVHKEFLEKPPVRALRTFDLLSIPFLVDHAFWGVGWRAEREWRPARFPHPVAVYVDLRAVLIEDAGGGKTLLNPLIYDPETNGLPPALRDRVLVHAPLEGRLATLGIDPGDIDCVVFDHLHFYDLRPIVRLFPRARLMIQEVELAWTRHLHALDALFHVRGGAEVESEGIVGGEDLGPSMALIPTPGHTPGHQTLVVRLPDGIATFSGNAISIDNYYPEESPYPQVAAFAREQGLEVLPISDAFWSVQAMYDSMVLEKTVASPRTTYSTMALSDTRRVASPIGRLPLPPLGKYSPRLRIGDLSPMGDANGDMSHLHQVCN